MNKLFAYPRKLVSGKKVRYQQDSFDLDLTYTAPDKRIITMGFPSTGIEHMYRNPRGELARFLDTYHLEHYKVFNLCCEPGRGYPSSVFHGNVERWPFRDHCVPPLETMMGLTNSAKAWLEADGQNVIALHCKAGGSPQPLALFVAQRAQPLTPSYPVSPPLLPLPTPSFAQAKGEQV